MNRMISVVDLGTGRSPTVPAIRGRSTSRAISTGRRPARHSTRGRGPATSRWRGSRSSARPSCGRCRGGSTARVPRRRRRQPGHRGTAGQLHALGHRAAAVIHQTVHRLAGAIGLPAGHENALAKSGLSEAGPLTRHGRSSGDW